MIGKYTYFWNPRRECLKTPKPHKRDHKHKVQHVNLLNNLIVSIPSPSLEIKNPMCYTQIHMKRNYELVVVLDGKATAAKKKTSIEKIEKFIKTLDGKVVDVLDWGVKDLAYPIKKIMSGAYTIFQVELPAAAARVVNEKLRLENDILRYLLMTKETKIARIKNSAKEARKENKDEQKS